MIAMPNGDLSFQLVIVENAGLHEINGKMRCIVSMKYIHVVLIVLFAGAAPAFAQETQPTTRSSGAIPTLDEVFATLDKNHDGRITREEATGVYARRFSLWDSKGRGYVTRQDVHDFRIGRGINDDGSIIAPSGGGAAAPTILKYPDDWRFEAIAVPPPFAPDVKLNGSEEARFAKGMFDPLSKNYFTYAFAITADGNPKWGAPELRDFLATYFRGLSESRARRNGGPRPAIEQIQAVVAPASGAETSNRFTAEVNFVDTFNDGRKVSLHVEEESIERPATKQLVLIFLVSPSAKDSDAWENLYEIREKAVASARR